MSGKRIEDLGVYGAPDLTKIKKNIYEVSKNSGTYVAPVYLPADSKKQSLEELADDVASVLPAYLQMLEPESYLIVKLTGDHIQNGVNLYNAVMYAKSVVSTRFVVFLMPGVYNLAANCITGANALNNYIDIVGIGNPEEIVIIGDDPIGTIEINPTADYILQNLTIGNTVGNFSLSHNAPGTDVGRWINLRLYAGNTPNINFAGRYENIKCFSDNVLNGSILGTVENCDFQAYSCGSAPAGIVISGLIKNCTGSIGCFGVSATSSVNISGKILDCDAGQNSFGFASDYVLISGIVKRCNAGQTSFGCAYVTNSVTISGFIEYCNAGYNSFGTANGGYVLFQGATINNCTSGSDSFGRGPADIVIDGNTHINDCFAGDYSFGCSGGSGSVGGNVSIAGSLKRCEGGVFSFGGVTCGIGNTVISGTIFNCRCTTGFGYNNTGSPTGTVTISGNISDCIVGSGFGFAANTVTISGRILRCISLVGNAFGYSGYGVGVGISGTIENCKSFGDSSFGCSGFSVTIYADGVIKDCTSGAYSFCSSGGGAAVTMAGLIKNCSAGAYSFARADGNVTMSGEISGCDSSGHYCFASSSLLVNLSGIIKDCIGQWYSFAYSNGGGVQVDGTIKNCQGVNLCFACCDYTAACTVNGSIIGCVAIDTGGANFATAGGAVIISSTAIIQNCTSNGGRSFGRSSTSTVVIAGIIEGCEAPGSSFGFTDNFAANVSITGLIRNCYNGGAGGFGYGYTGAVDISGKIINCEATQKAFAYSEVSTATISGEVSNCTGTDQCFASSLAHATISGLIKNCKAKSNSFCSGGGNILIDSSAVILNCQAESYSYGYSSASHVVISGLIKYCIGFDRGFGFSAAGGNTTIDGIIDNCSATDFAFGYSSGVTTISGQVSFCTAGTQSFAGVGGTTLVSGTIKDCVATTMSFGATDAGGKLIRCVRTGGQNAVIQLGTIDDCRFSENDAVINTLMVGAGAIVRNSIIYQAGAADSIKGNATPTAVNIYFTAMNKAFNANISNFATNSTAQNIVDVAITL